jgi:HKD family nuclease
MNLIVKLPNEFKEHFETDKFQDSLNRLIHDIDSYSLLSGKYEKELLYALRNAFKKAQEMEI